MDESIVKHLEAPAKVLRLSEAIRIGAKLRPQCFGYAFKDGGSCTWGAAWEGSGGKYLDRAITKWRDEWSGAAQAYQLSYHSMIVDSNDRDGMSREQIADRLAAIGY